MLRFTIALPLLAAVAQATTFLKFGSGALPSCAKTCTLMNQAQDACLTSTETCFCQSGYLTTLWSASSQPVCSDTCPSSAEAQIKSWYTRTCASMAPPGAVIPDGTPTTPVPSSGASSTAAPTDPNVDQGSWWDDHGRWILMIAILIVAFGVIIFVGIWLKRRHKRKKLAEAAGPGPSSWGPRTSQHYGESDAEKGAAARANPTTSSTTKKQEKRKSGKLAKMMGK